MNNIKTTLCLALLTTLTWPAAQAMASTDRCWIEPVLNNQMKIFVQDLGTLYVPRDARLGTSIYSGSMQRTPDQNNLNLRCETYGTRMNFDMRAAHGVNVPLLTVDGRLQNDPIIKTNIPGVGAIIELGLPFTGLPDHFIPDRLPAKVPFTSYYERTQLTVLSFFSLFAKIDLVKIGDLAPGNHRLDGTLATGHLDYNGMGKVVDFTLRANIIQTQCDVLADAVSANPVDLGEWSTDDFTGPGFTTRPTPFQIRLSSCLVDPDPGNQTLATIELDGINGSQPIEPAGANVFSLTHDSEARGIGIQMLYKGNPMPLNTELDLTPLPQGNIPFDFQARFYQTGSNSQVRAGLAKGALNFTIRYR